MVQEKGCTSSHLFEYNAPPKNVTEDQTHTWEPKTSNHYAQLNYCCIITSGLYWLPHRISNNDFCNMIRRQSLQTTLDRWVRMIPSQLLHKWMKTFKGGRFPRREFKWNLFPGHPRLCGGEYSVDYRFLSCAFLLTRCLSSFKNVRCFFFFLSISWHKVESISHQQSKKIRCFLLTCHLSSSSASLRQYVNPLLLTLESVLQTAD